MRLTEKANHVLLLIYGETNEVLLVALRNTLRMQISD